jgi:hypothetical protein
MNFVATDSIKKVPFDVFSRINELRPALPLLEAILTPLVP